MSRATKVSAFTLLEMLIAAGITALLASVMLTVVVNALNSWSRSHGALATESQARLLLDQLAFDLEGAVNRADGQVWLALSVQPNADAIQAGKPDRLDPLATNSAELSDAISGARFGSGGMWLRLITSAPVISASSANAGAVAVSYEMGRLATSSSAGVSRRYMLVRTEASPSVTFAGGYNLDPAVTAPSYLGTLRTLTPEKAIADGVIDFGAWAYVRGTNGALQRVFPDAAGTASGSFPKTNGDFPAVIDLMIRVLTPEGVRQIQAIESGLVTGDWWQVAVQHSKVFTRRVTLRPRSL